MKLTRVNILKEADISRGRRLLKLKEISVIIKSAVEAGGYVFKDAGDKGFYILPKQHYIAKIVLDQLTGENIYNVTIFNALGEEQKQLETQVLADVTFNDAMVDDIVPKALGLIFQMTQQDISALKNNLGEASLPKFLQKIIDKTKENIDTSAATRLEKQQDKINAKETKDTFNAVAKQAEAATKKAISNMVGRNRDLKVKVDAKAGHIDILIIGDVIAGVIYSTDRTANQLKIEGCITAVAEHKDLNSSLMSFLNLINRKLKLNIKIKDQGALKITGSSDKEIEKINSYETELKDLLDDDILTKLGENLSEALGDNTTRYNNALSAIKNADQGNALVKLYFYKETGNKLKLTDTQAKELWKAVDAVNSFDVSRSPLIKAFVNYYNENVNKSSDQNLEKELKNLITILTDNNFISKIIDIDKASSLIYNASVIGNPVPSSVTHDLYNKHMLIKNNRNGFGRDGIAGKLAVIKEKLNIDVPEPTAIKKYGQLADFMLFVDYTNSKNLRDLQQINDIFDILGGTKAFDSVSTKGTPNNKPFNAAEIKKLDGKQLDKIKSVFAVEPGIEGPEAVSKIVAKLRTDKDIKNILTQLLNQL